MWYGIDNLLRVILCLEDKESRSLYVHNCFCVVSWGGVHSSIEYKWFLNRSVSPVHWTLTGVTTLGVLAMKGYSTFPKSPKLEPYHHRQFVIPRHPPLFVVGVLPLIVSIFWALPIQLYNIGVLFKVIFAQWLV